MNFDQQLHDGLLLKRYKRFFCDIQSPEGVMVGHVPNTGSLKGCLNPPQPCLYALHTDPKRKLKATLFMVQVGEAWVGVNTALPNKLVGESLSDPSRNFWKEFPHFRAEFAINKQTRLDFVLWKQHVAAPTISTIADTKDLSGYLFVEIKNVTMKADQSRHPSLAQFPDAKTDRGLKHIRELMSLKERGAHVALIFVVQRTDCTHFSAAAEIDPLYAEALEAAKDQGLEVLAWPCQMSAHGIFLDPSKALVQI